jgi:hypothetical protein
MNRSRYAIRDSFRAMDPERDHQHIVYVSGAYEFPWLTRKALEFALFRTYAVPSISKLLDETGQFANYGQKRYDDTALIIAEIGEQGYDSERGRAAIRRMNRLHHRFEISNEDYLYVLSTFIYEPIRWTTRFGWREPIAIEREAGYIFWREVGRRMGIKDIPPTYDAFEAYNIAYERDHFHYTDSNNRVGEATVQIFLNWYPKPLRPTIRRMIYAMMDDPLREAFGFPKVHNVLTAIGTGGLRLRGGLIRRIMPPRRRPYHFTEAHSRTYPQGYAIEALGPDDVPPDAEMTPEDTVFDS